MSHDRSHSTPRILRAARTHLWVIIIFTVIVSGAATALSLMIEPTYKARVSLYRANEKKSGGGVLGSLSGIANALGYDLSGGTTPFHVPDLVESRRLLGTVLSQRWKTTRFDSAVTLTEFWDLENAFSPTRWVVELFTTPEPSTPEKLFEAGLTRLEESIDVKEEQSGLYEIFVWLEEPELSADVANYMAEFIQSYVAGRTTSRSSDYRAFLEDRLAQAEEDLTESEKLLTRFRKIHPRALDSPELQEERGRLTRSIELNQQVFITLRQQYELARLDELKDKPILEILDAAVAPVKKDKPKRMFIVLGAFFGALLLSLYTAVAVERYKQAV